MVILVINVTTIIGIIVVFMVIFTVGISVMFTDSPRSHGPEMGRWIMAG